MPPRLTMQRLQPRTRYTARRPGSHYRIAALQDLVLEIVAVVNGWQRLATVFENGLDDAEIVVRQVGLVEHDVLQVVAGAIHEANSGRWLRAISALREPH